MNVERLCRELLRMGLNNKKILCDSTKSEAYSQMKIYNLILEKHNRITFADSSYEMVTKGPLFGCESRIDLFLEWVPKRNHHIRTSV